MKRFGNPESGQAMMVATMFFLVVSTTIIFGLVGPIVREQKIVSSLLLSRQSYYVAEAGVEDAIYRIKTAKPISASESLTIGGSSATIAISDTPEGKNIIAIGDASERIRKIESNLTVGEGVTFHYGIQVGVGGLQLSNNSGVNGNVYSNGNISGSNGSFITGSAFAVGSISGVNVSGEEESGVAPAIFPIVDTQITGWKDEAAAGGTVGSQTLSGTNNTLGPKKINGNLTLSNNARLTVTGTLWITGNLVLSNTSQVRLSAGYGLADGIIIVDGTSTLSNDSVFSGSGAEGSYIMLLSTNSTGSAVILSNNAGAVILYAPNGTVQLSNNAEVKQISAKTIYLSNNATIDYETGLVDASFTSGPSGGYEIDTWREIE